MPLAVTVPVEAEPLAMVAGLLASVQLALLPGTVKVIWPPLTGSPLADVTLTINALAKLALTVAL